MTEKIAFTKTEAADAVGLSTKTLDRAIKAGELGVRYVGTKALIPADELKAWLDALPDQRNKS